MMKSKFEKELRDKAYSAVPDGWEEVEKKAGVFEPSGIIAKAKTSPVRTVIAAAAAVAVVTGAGFAIKAMQRSPLPYEADNTEAVQAAVTEQVTKPEDGAASASDETTVPETQNPGDSVFDALEPVTDENG